MYKWNNTHTHTHTQMRARTYTHLVGTAYTNQLAEWTTYAYTGSALFKEYSDQMKMKRVSCEEWRRKKEKKNRKRKKKTTKTKTLNECGEQDDTSNVIYRMKSADLFVPSDWKLISKRMDLR